MSPLGSLGLLDEERSHFPPRAILQEKQFPQGWALGASKREVGSRREVGLGPTPSTPLGAGGAALGWGTARWNQAMVGGGEERGLCQNSPPPPTAGLQTPGLGFTCPTADLGDLSCISFFGSLLSASISFLHEQAPGQGKGCKNMAFWPGTQCPVRARARAHTHTLTHNSPPSRVPAPARALGTRPGSRHLAKSSRAPCVAHWLKFLHEVEGVG